MFFSVDILCRKDAQFGLIWLAAMRLKKLKRREIESVDVVRTCENLMRYLPQSRDQPANVRKRKLFSLYLASQLAYGTVVVFHQQHKYLLQDLKGIIDNIKKLLTVGSSIDMENPIGRNIDMPDPLLAIDPMVFANFGRPDFRISQSPVILDYNDQDYIEVRTARSDRSASVQGAPYRHLARPADITLQEDEWSLISRHPMMEEELPPAQEGDVFPTETDTEAFEATVTEDLLPPAQSPIPREQPEMEPMITEPVVTSASPIEETMYHYQMEEEPMAPPPLPPRRFPPEPDVTVARPEELRQHPARRAAPIVFALEPLSQEQIEEESPHQRGQPRRGRFRLRAMDRTCIIPGEEMNRQINDFETNVRSEPPTIDVGKVARRAHDNWMTTPCLGIGASIRGIYESNLVSRRVPGTFEDIFHSPPWTVPQEVSDYGTAEPLQPYIPPPMEEEEMPPQVEPTGMDLGAPVYSEVSSAEAGRQQLKRTMESFGLEEPRTDVAGMDTGTREGINMENIIEEPYQYPEEMMPPPAEEPAAKRPRARSPPPVDHLARCYPPLPDMPTAPSQTVQLQDEQLINHINEMTAGGRAITFHEICPPATTTKAQAAKTFYKMLELYKGGYAITMDQDIAYGPITIRRC